ncbi:uncharacterized protein MAM_04985 [Metarhizium album ARSEF 1941]|uniref:Uncharacterized protein n=1 Tax=Metarhizium album (strain ARSEF 1941) TaxID=1081103 RepID=A0A0B2WTL2_METAS|nr:uncharacterized protein MAM_04985 [Metarhizium album ARSEF 1941]KHN97388.1 hypothetical protein MAM_04985 [Metarhizium album ARSEF 1941]
MTGIGRYLDQIPPGNSPFPKYEAAKGRERSDMRRHHVRGAEIDRRLMACRAHRAAVEMADWRRSGRRPQQFVGSRLSLVHRQPRCNGNVFKAPGPAFKPPGAGHVDAKYALVAP